jgi:hypothetical protein
VEQTLSGEAQEKLIETIRACAQKKSDKVIKWNAYRDSEGRDNPAYDISRKRVHLFGRQVKAAAAGKKDKKNKDDPWRDLKIVECSPLENANVAAFALSADDRADWKANGYVLGKKLYRDIITEPPKGHLPYFIMDDSFLEAAGLTSAEMCVDSGIDTDTPAGRVGGVSLLYLYIALRKGTGTAWHVEDLGLWSSNINTWGAAKLWVVVSPLDHDEFERRLVTHASCNRPDCMAKHGVSRPCKYSSHAAPECDQAARHESFLCTLDLLDGLRYSLVPHLPGQIMITAPGAYHQVLNAGPTVAAAVNFSLDVPGLTTHTRESRECTSECPVDDPAGQKRRIEDMLQHVRKTMPPPPIRWENNWSATRSANPCSLRPRVADPSVPLPHRSTVPPPPPSPIHDDGYPNLELLAKLSQACADLSRAQIAEVLADITTKFGPGNTASPGTTAPGPAGGAPTHPAHSDPGSQLNAPSLPSPSATEPAVPGTTTSTPPAPPPTPAAATASSHHGQKRLSADTAPSQGRPKKPKVTPPPLSFSTALHRLRQFAEGYAHRYKSDKPRYKTPLDPRTLAGQVAAHEAATALLRNESEKALLDLETRLILLWIAILYHDANLKGQTIKKDPSKARKHASCGQRRKFVTEVLGLPDEDEEERRFARWMLRGKRYRALSAGKWEGRWVLAVMEDVDAWGSNIEVGAWMESWDMTGRRREYLEGLAREFVDAVADGEEFDVAKVVPMDEVGPREEEDDDDDDDDHDDDNDGWGSLGRKISSADLDDDDDDNDNDDWGGLGRRTCSTDFARELRALCQS